MEAAACPVTEDRILDVVRHTWGWSALRPFQREAIEAAAQGRDCLLVLPTGGGKSLCYQVPPLLDQQLHVVVSPLIALMKDQVDALKAVGYPAACLHAQQGRDDRDEAWQAMAAGTLRLLFVSPERMLLPGFAEQLRSASVASLTVDEAHCISQWGHDFRPEYRQLGALRAALGDVPLRACTATATPPVREDIVRQLGMREPKVFVGPLDRPNLLYRVQPRLDRYNQVHEALMRHKGRAAIVYCNTRKGTERMAAWLKGKRHAAEAYHAGMEQHRREEVHDAFMAESINVVAATVAFGMGIDRSDVRCVVHADMPASLEAFQQESGRAGRDGLPAESVLLWSGADAAQWRSRQEGQDPRTGKLLEAMTGFCATAQCRRVALARHFGVDPATDACSSCDVCLGEVAELPESTTLARKVLSAVVRVEQRFGIGHVVDVLRGSTSEAIRRQGHGTLSVHGLLGHMDKKSLTNVMWQCVHLGLLQRSDGDRPVVLLTPEGKAVLTGAAEAKFTAPPSRPARAFQNEAGLDETLVAALRSVRRQLAAAQGVPAYVIFSDVTLRALAAAKPDSRAALGDIPGIGDHRVDRYGEAILKAIATARG